MPEAPRIDARQEKGGSGVSPWSGPSNFPEENPRGYVLEKAFGTGITSKRGRREKLFDTFQPGATSRHDRPCELSETGDGLACVWHLTARVRSSSNAFT